MHRPLLILALLASAPVFSAGPLSLSTSGTNYPLPSDFAACELTWQAEGTVNSRLLETPRARLVSKSGYSWDKLDTIEVRGYLDLVTCKDQRLYHVRYSEFVGKGVVTGYRARHLKGVDASFGPSSKVSQADWFSVKLPAQLVQQRLEAGDGKFHVIVSFETSEYISGHSGADLPMAPLWGTNGPTLNPTSNLTLYLAYLQGWWRDDRTESNRAAIHTLLLNFEKAGDGVEVSTVVLPVSGLSLPR